MADGGAFPIRELSTNFKSWTIKARVSGKGDLRTFAKKGSSDMGALFACTLIDKDDGEIRAQFWNAGAEKWHSQLEDGKVYTFSQGSVRVANARYNTTSHQYELHFDDKAAILPAQDDARISMVKYNWVNIKNIRPQKQTFPATIDLMAVVKSSKSKETITFQRDGQDNSFEKRTLTVVDDTEHQMEVSLMNKEADVDDATLDGHPVIVIKDLLIKEYKEALVGSTTRGSRVEYNPSLPNVSELKEWFNTNDANCTYKSLSGVADGGARLGGTGRNVKMTTLAELAAEEEEKGTIETSMTYRVAGRIAQVKRDAPRKEGATKDTPMYYLACPGCKKKVLESHSGAECASCNKQVEPDPRYIHQIQIADTTSTLWMTSGNEQTEKFLGITAKALREAETNDLNEVQRVIGPLSHALYKDYMFTIRFKVETYQGEDRLKVFLNYLDPIDYVTDGNALAEEIKSMISLDCKKPRGNAGGGVKRAREDDGSENVTSKHVKAEEVITEENVNEENIETEA